MKRGNPNITGRVRHAVREIPCTTCGQSFGQTAHELKRNIQTCGPCQLERRKVFNPRKTRIRKSHIEILLPKAGKPFFVQSKGEWAMRVRVRKSRSKEEFKQDHIYLGCGPAADPETVSAAYTAAYARLEMQGHSTKPRKKSKKERTKQCDARSWKQGLDRNLGILKVVVKSLFYSCHLPDPYVDGKRHYVGRFKTMKEARKARFKMYNDLCHQYVPCAVCKRTPVYDKGMLTHIAHDCPNVIQLPQGMKPLYQAKLWNLVYSKGEGEPAGKLSLEDMYHMGYFRKMPKGECYKARQNVEFRLSLAKQFVVPRDDEAMFE
jgi:hypothetical protein